MLTVATQEQCIDQRSLLTGSLWAGKMLALASCHPHTTTDGALSACSETIKMLDLRKPHLWYPMARALQRRLVYHKGPTNSGKTYNALRAMRAAPSGVYCGPLRLLAMEVYDELNASGTHCNLTTGAPKSPHADAYAPSFTCHQGRL